MREHFSSGKFRARTFSKRKVSCTNIFQVVSFVHVHFIRGKLREQTFSKRKVSFVNIYCFELVCFVPEDVLYI